jgi:predicted RNase H-like HicB family nuclease
MTYRVSLIASQEGYAVYCPALPGCWSQGTTRQEALINIRDAIRDYLLSRRTIGNGLT